MRRPVLVALSGFAVSASALTAFAVAAPAVSHSARPCSALWPAAVRGEPAALSSRSSGFFLWRQGLVWHLRIRSSGTAMPVAGRLKTTGPLHVVATSARKQLKLSTNAVGLRLPALTGTMRLDIATRCASPLSVQLTDSAVSRQPKTFLGAHNRAPAEPFRLTRTGSTGVQGQIVVGPICPVLPCDATGPPVHGTVQIAPASTSKTSPGSGPPVATVLSDANGNFSANLAPGHYSATVVSSSVKGTAKPTVFDVEPAALTQIVATVDTGIR